MKFLAYENIPLQVVNNLKNKRVDIISLSESIRGMKDEKILELANKEKRTLITFDNDFGELIFRNKKENKGVILLRLHPQTIDYITLILQKVLSMKIDFKNSFCVVESHRIRVVPFINDI